MTTATRPTTKSGKVDAATAADTPVLAAGGVDGSGTPEGQCQWSPCASHSPDSAVSVEVGDGGVVGSGTPGGQCQWSRCGSHSLAGADTVSPGPVVGWQCPKEQMVLANVTHEGKDVGWSLTMVAVR